MKEHTQKVGSRVERWLGLTQGGCPSLQTLLYRHYLFDALSNEEIFLTLEYPQLYILMGSMYYQDVRFTTLEDQSLWDKIEAQEPVINLLRIHRPLIQETAIHFANRMDVTDHRLDRDHALLSSHSLLYGLYLTRVQLIFEQTVRPDPKLEAVLDSLTHTLSKLKGVFFHVENQWLCPHVR